jgi:hypothetical protein
MARDELRALADALESEAYLPDTSTKRKAASYLRACADAVPNVSVPAGSRTSQADWHLAALAAPVAQQPWACPKCGSPRRAHVCHAEDAAPVAQPQKDDLPTQAMCRAAVIYANGPDIYKRIPAEVAEIEEGIYAEVWKAMQAAAPVVAQPDDDTSYKPVPAKRVAREVARPPFNSAADCSPMLTQCPRCNNPHHVCDGGKAAPVVAQPDCRTCQNVSIRSGGCSSVFLCVDASMYKASPQVRYWKDTK